MSRFSDSMHFKHQTLVVTPPKSIPFVSKKFNIEHKLIAQNSDMLHQVAPDAELAEHMIIAEHCRAVEVEINEQILEEEEQLQCRSRRIVVAGVGELTPEFSEPFDEEHSLISHQCQLLETVSLLDIVTQISP